MDPRSRSSSPGTARSSTAPMAIEERYHSLEIPAALVRPWDYPTACRELSAVLRKAYARLPRYLQAIVFNDVLYALRILPDVQSSYGLSSVRILHQSAEAALQKQKKGLASSEYKQSIVALKRHAKTEQQAGGSFYLPNDLLFDVFTHLDARSLATVSLVCRAWCYAAEDNSLWKRHYANLFGLGSINSDDVEDTIGWKLAFQSKCKDLSLKFSSTRGRCTSCSAFIWLSDTGVLMSHACNKRRKGEKIIKPASADKVVQHLLGGTDFIRLGQ